MARHTFKFYGLNLQVVLKWEPQMFLKSVYLNRNEYGPSKGNLEGTVTFVGDHGEIKLSITDEQSRAFVALMAEALVASSKEIANKLTAEVLNERPLLLE